MFGVTTVVGVVILIVAIVALLKFAEGTITAVISVAVILVGIFLIFGAPGADWLGDAVGGMGGLIPGTGSTVFTGEAIDIANMENQGEVLAIYVENVGMRDLDKFEVSIAGAPANVVMSSSLLPGTTGTIIVDRKAASGDAIIVRANSARDEEIFSP
jgi:hypothetical protein